MKSVAPAKAGAHVFNVLGARWVPAFAGTTGERQIFPCAALASWIAFQTLYDVTGIAMLRMP